MRKGDILQGTIEEIRFPDKGIFHVKDARKDSTGAVIGDMEVLVKNALPGQKVTVRIRKKHAGRAEGMLLSVDSPSPDEIPAACHAFGRCGGCLYLTLPPEKEREIKQYQVQRLLEQADPSAPSWYEGILESPVTEGYRNKMELTFGDEVKDGSMTLGMHKRGSFYDVTDADECRIVNEDFRKIIHATKAYWSSEGTPFYHRMQQQGYLRHLLIREGMKTGDLMADLVTTTRIPGGNPAEEEKLLHGWVQSLLSLDLDGHFAGILHTHNDSVADVVEDQGTDILYGKDSFEEDLLGLRFTVTPFSFFQTNSYGAELLYETARNMIAETGGHMGAGHTDGSLPSGTRGSGNMAEERQVSENRKPVIFDLYCGTGTISQLVASTASKVIGVEIVKEAVLAAEKSAAANGITNCRFIAGDVLNVLDDIPDKPDLIILDPPRDGVHPKALPKIISYKVPYILYISCKPTSLARDLPAFAAGGYHPVKAISINQFPRTSGVETVCLLACQQQNPVRRDLV